MKLICCLFETVFSRRVSPLFVECDRSNRVLFCALRLCGSAARGVDNVGIACTRCFRCLMKQLALDGTYNQLRVCVWELTLPCPDYTFLSTKALQACFYGSFRVTEFFERERPCVATPLMHNITRECAGLGGNVNFEFCDWSIMLL